MSDLPEPSVANTGSVSTRREGEIAVLELAHGKANAMDVALLDSLCGALEASRSARAVVITARGSIFSAGVDLIQVLEGGRSYLEAFLPRLSDTLAEVFAHPAPVVAAINGHAIAGGAVLALACDYRIMIHGPWTIGIPELRVGVPFPLVPAEIVRFAMGSASAQRAMLSGNVVPSHRAVTEGYADELCDPERLSGRGLAVATAMSATVPASYARTKAMLRRPVLETWSQHRAARDRDTLEAWDSAEVRASIRDFVTRTLGKRS